MKKLLFLLTLLITAVACDKDDNSMASTEALEISNFEQQDEDYIGAVDGEITDIPAFIDGPDTSTSKNTADGVTLNFRSQDRDGRTRYAGFGDWISIGADEFLHLGIEARDRILLKESNTWTRIGWTGGAGYNHYSFLPRVRPGTKFFIPHTDLVQSPDGAPRSDSPRFITQRVDKIYEINRRVYAQLWISNPTNFPLENELNIEAAVRINGVWGHKAYGYQISVDSRSGRTAIIDLTAQVGVQVGDNIEVVARSWYFKSVEGGDLRRAALLPSKLKKRVVNEDATNTILGVARFPSPTYADTSVNIDVDFDGLLDFHFVNEDGNGASYRNSPFTRFDSVATARITLAQAAAAFSPPLGPYGTWTYVIKRSEDDVVDTLVIENPNPNN